MKKQALALILTSAIAMSTVACSSNNGGERRHRERRHDHETTTTTTDAPDETTTVTDIEPTDPVAVLPQTTVQMIGNTEFQLSDTYQYIFPYTYSCTPVSSPNDWEENNIFEVGFVDQDGNVICDPIYNMATLLTDANVYLVGRYDENDHMQYGLISLDGNAGTDLEYDGYYEVPGRTHYTPGYIYMSDYEDGVLTVDYFDNEINTIIEQAQITLNTDNFEYYTDDMMIRVEKIYEEEGRAVVMLWEDSYGPVGDYLIDTETGDVLASTDGWLRPVLTDSMFIDNDPDNALIIYDLDGNDITGDYLKAGDINSDKIAFFTQDRVDVTDDEGNVTATMPLGDDVLEVDVSNGKVLISTMEGIEIYDQDLNLITVAQDHYLGYGYTVDDFYNFTDGDVVLVEYETEQVVNLMTGATVNYNDELFYSGENGLIFADDYGTFYTIYEYSLDNVTAGPAEAALIRDRATGELYIVEVNSSDITKLYRVNGTDVEMIYQYDESVNIYGCEIVDGILATSDEMLTEDIVLDQDGNIIFEYVWNP